MASPTRQLRTWVDHYTQRTKLSRSTWAPWNNPKQRRNKTKSGVVRRLDMDDIYVEDLNNKGAPLINDYKTEETNDGHEKFTSTSVLWHREAWTYWEDFWLQTCSCPTGWLGLFDGLPELKERVAQHTQWRSTVLIFKALRNPSISKDLGIAPIRPTLQWFRGLPDELINLCIYSRRRQPTTSDSLRRWRRTCVTSFSGIQRL